jgi:RND family efflux transporter MFP subunit
MTTPETKPDDTKRYIRTGVLIVLALIFGWIIWYHYQLAPWTRDGRVRVQVANVSSEISGKIVEIDVQDNQRVKKGDPLFVIFKDDYQYALDQAEAVVESTKAEMDIEQTNANRREKLGSSVVSAEDIATYSATAVRARAAYNAAQAAHNLAKLNLDRTTIYSPVNGYVTNLEMRVGDYAHPGESKISIVDEDSFWVSAYFEETKLPRIHEGDTAWIKLMGVGPEIEGKVESISRGIADANTAKGSQSLPDVDPIFTWVRLAQRIPVRIKIEKVPDNVVLAAGQTCTVSVKSQ